MADDQNKSFNTTQDKSSTIDDLVKELSRNNDPKSSSPGSAPSTSLSAGQPGSQSDRGLSPTSPPGRGQAMASPSGPPPNLPGVKVGNRPTDKAQDKPSVPSRPTPSTLPPVGQPPRPRPFNTASSPASSLAKASGDKQSLSTEPRPVDSPAKSNSGLEQNGAKPYLIQEYKSSIRTMGDDITSIKSGQKPSGVEMPRKVAPEAPKAPMPAPKRETPGPVGPRPSVDLGRAERTGPLPAPTVPQKPGEPSKPGQTRLGSPEIQPPITAPKEKKGLSMTFYFIIAGVLLVGGIIYWFYLRPVEPEVVLVPTPTPAQTATPTPVIRSLSDVFDGTPTNFEVTLSDNISRDFKIFTDTLTVGSSEFSEINLVQDIDGTLVSLNWLDMFDMGLTVYPFGLRDNIEDSIVLTYGQAEMFNKDGTIDFGAEDTKKTVFVARVSNIDEVLTMLNDWELTITDDLADYLLIDDTSAEASVNFLDNTYRGVPIRYKNFPFPDTAVDYAVVEAVGQSYLVIAGSREAMFATIDTLLEQ